MQGVGLEQGVGVVVIFPVAVEQALAQGGVLEAVLAEKSILMALRGSRVGVVESTQEGDGLHAAT